MASIITPKTFNADLIKFHDIVKSKKNGGKIMAISYNGNKLRLQSEEMTVPFGINSFQDESTKSVTSSLVCSLDNCENSEKMKRFLDVLEAFDKKLLEKVAESSSEIMGKEMSLEVLREFFRPVVKPPSDPKYSPLLKVKIAPLSGNSGEMPRVFNFDKTKTDIDHITKGCSVKLIIEIPYAYFVNKNFGASVKLFQACITKASNKVLDPDSYVFFDDDEETGDNGTPGMEFDEDDF